MSEEIATRRKFLFQTTKITCGFGIVHGLAPKADAQLTYTLGRAVLWLGEHVLAPSAVSAFTQWLSSAKIVSAPEDNSFHGQFSPGVQYDRPFEANPTRWTGYMGVDGFPTLNTLKRTTREGELNLAEIAEMQNSQNPNLWYGGYLRLAPISQQLTRGTHAARPARAGVGCLSDWQ
jgi:hypothetical protein